MVPTWSQCWVVGRVGPQFGKGAWYRGAWVCTGRDSTGAWAAAWSVLLSESRVTDSARAQLMRRGRAAGWAHRCCPHCPGRLPLPRGRQRGRTAPPQAQWQWGTGSSAGAAWLPASPTATPPPEQRCPHAGAAGGRQPAPPPGRWPPPHLLLRAVGGGRWGRWGDQLGLCMQQHRQASAQLRQPLHFGSS